MNIYLNTETNFENNGLGFLNDCTKANVYETLNGDYYLELTYPVNGNLNQYLIEENIIKCNVGNNDYQLFKITRVTKDFSLINVYAKHISYNLLDNMILDAYPQNKNCQAFGEWILDKTDFKHPFSFYSDITNTASARYIQKNPIEAIMGSENNSMVNLFAGELERDNFTIKMLKNRGVDNGVKLIFGKNIKSINITIDISSLFTRLLPVGGNSLMLPEKYVDSPLINTYPTPKIARVEFSDIKYDPNDENSYPSEEEAIIALRAAANELFEKGIDKPSINIKIDWVELSKTKEYYEEYYNLEKVNLGDTITANILGIDYTTKVIKTNYNVLTDTIDNFEIGSVSASITSTINTQSSKINDINPNNILEEAIKNSTSLITSAMGGFVYKTNEELYIMDTNDINTAQRVWRWNINGLGYSKNGVNGPYGIAMTMDGSINADFITSGMIQTNRVQGLDSLIIDIQAKQGEITKEITTRKTATGNPTYIEDSGGYALEKDFIYGMSIQETTNGKNICPTDFDIEWIQGQYTTSGGTDTISSRIRVKRLIDVLPNATYYVNTFSDGKYAFVLRTFDSNGTFVKSLGGLADGSTFTTKDGETKIGITIYINESGITFDTYKAAFEDGTIKPFICLDSETDKTFEKYIPNGISPDYPSEIINNSGIENLFDGLVEVGGYNNDTGEKSTNNAQLRNTNMINVLPNSIYSFSLNSKSINLLVRYFFYDRNKKWLSSNTSEDGKIITPDNCYYVNWHSTALKTNYGTELPNPMITKGEKVPPYIYGSNYLVQEICGKNKFNPNTSINGAIGTNGIISSSSRTKVSNYIEVKANETYTLSYEYTSLVTTNNRAYCLYDKKQKYLSGALYSPVNKTLSITPTQDGFIRIGYDINVTEIQFEKDAKTEYEPYKEKQILFDLQGNELCGLEDINIRDNVEFVSGLLTKKIGKAIFSSCASHIANPSGETKYQLTLGTISDLKTSNWGKGLCNRFKIGTGTKANNILRIGANNEYIYIYTDDENFSSKTNADNWLSNNPVEVYYELETPQTIQLEPTEIKLYEGINNIYTESNVNVEEVDITYLTKSTLNQDFLSKAEFSIEKDEINQEVSQKVGENEIVASINTAIKDGQGVVEFTGNSVIISADNMSVDKYGNLVCQNAVIRGGELILNDDGTHENAAIKIKTNKKIIKDIAITSDLNDSYLTQTFGDKFNFREAPSEIIFTTDENYQVKLLRTTVGSSSHVVGYTHQVVVSNNNDYNEIIYEVFHNQDEGIFTTNIDIQELQLPSEFGVVKTINSSTYLPYIKRLLINAGLTTYSSEGMEADIYSNYKYTRDDVIKVQNYLLDKVTLTDEEILFYDTNGDGKVTLSDWIVIQYNGGQYNVSDSQPGKFILDTTGINENLYVLDKDGNRIVSIGVTGTKVLTLNNPIFPDSYNEIEVGEALTYRNLESICGTWINGKLIYRKVLPLEGFSSNSIVNVDADVEQITKLEGIYNIGGAQISVNTFINSTNYAHAYYRYSDNTIVCGSTWDVEGGHIVIEYTKK